ncbi:MAG: serine/threonine-protein kinase [Steroidobacteraceae bacterium]
MPRIDLSTTQAAALNELLDQALDRRPEERAGWLEQVDATHPDLAPYLRDLLARAASVEARDFLRALPSFNPPGEALRPADRELSAGTIIGPYCLVRELGRGGMGSVWLAGRIDGLLSRQIALKLPHGAWPRAQLAERLQRERDILAALEHPNIARLYDAGLTPDGQPYLALEYVEGQPIDEICWPDEVHPRYDVPARVRLFLQVARAVAYAHGKLVLHRDLKPANILVAADGTVRLLDFGIAKLLADGETHETELTQFAGRALSPDYASPEQIGGEPLGVTSDVYSLGVVLYELLANVRPYRLKRNSRGELEEAILHTDPRRPSEVAIAADRRALRGDLDTIVLQALKKDPAARYPTANALIDDLERALDGRPVSARPDTVGYRTGKFIRRHQLVVGAAALLLLALIGGTIGTSVGMVRARRAEVAARMEAATAGRYSTFLVDLFEINAPEGSKGREVTAREILEQGTTRIRTELAGEPLLQARLLATIGWVYTRQGRYMEARPLLDEAVERVRSTGENGRGDLAQALVRRGENERNLNESSAAEADDREALSLLEHLYGPDDVRVVPALTELGLLLRTSNPDQALGYYRRSHDLLVAAHGDTDGDAAVLLGNIGSMYLRSHQYSQAKDAYEQALPKLRKNFGERDPHVASVLGNLSVVYRSLGDYARAAQMARLAFASDTEVSGPDHPNVGMDWQSLALSSDKLGNPTLALEQIDHAISIFNQRLPPGHPLYIQAVNSKAELLVELGRSDDARQLIEPIQALQPGGADSRRSVLHSLVILAGIERLGKHLGQSQSLMEGVLSDPDIQTDRSLEAAARWVLACALAAQGQGRAADAERLRALALEPAGTEAPVFLSTVALSKYQMCAGRADQAIATLRTAVAAGFHDPVILRDPDLQALRAHPEFSSIMAAVASRLPRSGATASPDPVR